MAGAIIFDILITLAGQPASFWNNPQTAMRGDGLSIYNPTNHVFVFFLGSGWPAYLVTSTAYLLAIYLLVTLLPRKLALIAMLSVIFAHYYDGSNWLAVHWHLGLEGPFFYGLAIAGGITKAANTFFGTDRRIKRLCWIMIFAMLTDAVVTLCGQPRGYWHSPALVDEGNPASKFFLMQGWFAYVFEQAIICMAIFYLVSILSKRWGLFTAICFTLAGFTGASNWFFYRWIWGMEGPVIFGVMLSTAMVLFTVHSAENLGKTHDSGTAQSSHLAMDARKKAWLLDDCS
jgi:hypothetical protein